MSDNSIEECREFLLSRWADTQLLSIHDGQQLLAFAVTDMLDDALSAVYTVFDPEYSQRGLGTYAVLSQIDYCRSLSMDYLYLGYWIDGHPKMDYKSRFAAMETYDIEGGWQAIGF